MSEHNLVVRLDFQQRDSWVGHIIVDITLIRRVQFLFIEEFVELSTRERRPGSSWSLGDLFQIVPLGLGRRGGEEGGKRMGTWIEVFWAPR
jgi:hypothetical protein